MSRPPRVRIHYTRPPDRVDVFVQDLVLDGEAVKITFARDLRMDDPVTIDGDIALEDGSDVVWFTFPGTWHDIGRFHRADGTFTGVYANVLSPCSFEPGHIWRTTDLFLDLWIPASEWSERRSPRVLDEDELADAVRKGWVPTDQGERARREASDLVREARAGRWPPAIVGEWPRERALAAVRTATPEADA